MDTLGTGTKPHVGTVAIVFFLPDGKVFQTVILGKTPFTGITADTAFFLDCEAVVYLDGQRMDERAATKPQLFELLTVAAAKGYANASVRNTWYGL